MKKVILLAAIVSIGFSTSAQTMVQSYDNETFKHFFSTKLKVALGPDTAYNNAIKKAVETYWTITPYEYCDYKPLFEKKSTAWKDDKYCYLLPLPWSYFASDLNFTPGYLTLWSTQGFNIWLSIVPGGGKNISSHLSLDQYSNICYAPLNSYGNEAMVGNCAYRLGLIIKSMNDAILLVKNNHIKEKPLNMITATYAEFNKKAPAIKGKTLLVNESSVKEENFWKKFMIKEEVLKKYNGSYKILSQQEIAKLIAEKNNQYALLAPAICENKEWFVYDLATMDLVFAFHKNSGKSIDESDIMLLNKAMNGK